MKTKKEVFTKTGTLCSPNLGEDQKTKSSPKLKHFFSRIQVGTYVPEVESRTQGSRPRPRTQKKSEAKAKDSLSENRLSRGQGQECSRPRAKDQGHKRKCSPKKKKGLHKNFSGDLQIKKKGLHKNFLGDLQKKKVISKIFQANSTKIRFPKNFSSAPQNFNIPKNSAVLEPRTGQFSRT